VPGPWRRCSCYHGPACARPHRRANRTPSGTDVDRLETMRGRLAGCSTGRSRAILKLFARFSGANGSTEISLPMVRSATKKKKPLRSASNRGFVAMDLQLRQHRSDDASVVPRIGWGRPDLHLSSPLSGSSATVDDVPLLVGFRSPICPCYPPRHSKGPDCWFPKHGVAVRIVGAGVPGGAATELPTVTHPGAAEIAPFASCLRYCETLRHHRMRRERVKRSRDLDRRAAPCFAPCERRRTI
jgi:hypothetical protein